MKALLLKRFLWKLIDLHSYKLLKALILKLTSFFWNSPFFDSFFKEMRRESRIVSGIKRIYFTCIRLGRESRFFPPRPGLPIPTWKASLWSNNVVARINTTTKTLELISRVGVVKTYNILLGRSVLEEQLNHPLIWRMLQQILNKRSWRSV